MKKLLIACFIALAFAMQANAQMTEEQARQECYDYYKDRWESAGGTFDPDNEQWHYNQLKNCTEKKVSGECIDTPQLSCTQRRYGFVYDESAGQKIAIYPSWFKYYAEVVRPQRKNYFYSCEKILDDYEIGRDIKITRKIWQNLMVTYCN